jgi:hypothetical protein
MTKTTPEQNKASSFTRASCQEDYFRTLIRLRFLSPVNPKTADVNAERLAVEGVNGSRRIHD